MKNPGILLLQRKLLNILLTGRNTNIQRRGLDPFDTTMQLDVKCQSGNLINNMYDNMAQELGSPIVETVEENKKTLYCNLIDP